MSKKKWWAAGVQFECQGTGKCCTSRGEYGFIYLTKEDEARLSDHLGISRKTLEKQYGERTEGLLHLQNPDKDCQFLEESRCGVYEGRPTQCRTWPFWPENMESKAWAEVADFCPGVGKGLVRTAEEIQAQLDLADEDDDSIGQVDEA